MKLNKKGFTLIELLAIITIMGILMMVAIPAVSRTIENSRRDTFANLTKQYIESVRNAVIADELSCTIPGEASKRSVSSTLAGRYYFLISTKEAVADGDSVQNTTDLMESGGKSSWGNNDVIGIVVWDKTNSTSGTSGFKIDYYAMLVDSGNHGLDKLTLEENIKRSTIHANTGETIKYDDIKSVDKLYERVTSNSELTNLSFANDTTVDGKTYKQAIRCTLDK